MKNSNIREKNVEARLVRKVKSELKGAAYKYTSPSRRSVPDRILLFSGYCVFVEAKRPGQTWTGPQARERDKLRALGQKVYLVDSYKAVDDLMLKLVMLT